MSGSMKQSLALKHALRMTPQLQQAIKLLQLSRMELETEIRKELVENPVLEEGMDSVADETTKEEREASSELSQPDTDMQDPRKQDEFEWDSYFENQQKTRETNFSGGNDEIMNYENILASTETLHDHLHWQASLYGFNEEELNQVQTLIDYINDSGYLKTEIEQIAIDENMDAKDLEESLAFIHEFDPAGVGARDLKECLLIQAKHIQEDTHDLVKLINEHLHDLERKNYAGIAKGMDISVEEVIDISKIINTMEPKPGRAFSANDTHYVTPDVYVYKVAEEYVISLNEDGMPKLKISNFYKNMLQGKDVKGDTQDYIQDKLRSAVWLIKSIHQRQRTIYKVAESIVKHQMDFFDKGPSHIRPMILRDIANDIEMHESTVSRVTTAKYMHTPQGIFELKYFFNSGISKDGGGSLASESVKLKIKKMVDDEDPKKPLSDQKIVEALKKEGIQIARRTVAKYRDVLKILPSSKRKKFY